MSEPLWQWSAARTAAAIRSGDVTCHDVVSDCVAHMRRVNPALNAVVVDLGDAALAEAAAADEKIRRREPLGLLHGVPVTVKENVDIAGRANPNGVPALQQLVATEDSPVVRNLKAAGAIIVGLTNTPEFSMRGFTDNPLYGLTLNPWDADITCGGSSGGAAASLAAGIGALAHGNDIGGSLRWPAHCNGLVTLRATQGRIPAFNSSAAAERPLMAQLFSVQGTLGRSVEDVRLGLEVLSVGDIRDPWWVPAPLTGPALKTPVKVAKAVVPPDMNADPTIMAHIDQAAMYLEREGYQVEEVELPDLMGCWQAWADLLVGEMRVLQEDMLAGVSSADFMQVYDAYKAFARPQDMKGYMQGVADRSRHLRNWMLLLQDYPVLLTPLSVAPAFSARADLDGADAVAAMFRDALRFIGVVNYLGLPAAAVPVGLQDGHPVGVQLIAARFREDVALDAAAAIERHAGILVKQLWQRQGI